MSDITELLNKNKEAVRVREDGDLPKSRQLFQNLLKRAAILKDSDLSEEIDVYMLIVGEWIIQLRHEGKKSLNEALENARGLYVALKEKGIRNPRIIRGISNTLMDLGDYEVAEGYLEELLSVIPKEDSARRGDTMAHLARCHYRTSRKGEAWGEIKKALDLIDKNPGKSSPLEIAAWKSHALRVESLLHFSDGKGETALILAEEVLRVAKKENIIPRINEANELIKFLLSLK